ncbi:hypothetical protein C7I85_23545 [Mesorhizobium soli]|uniref:Uncharacterized protein n=1 Tax=Pseudaminobacter soli (ex Li et al. 2025) TaxID=1295366 RepID=A0A2P7S325_9HYPH|nr:hypothetical protein C7I85_23545 [Mesorhizobium soli]
MWIDAFELFRVAGILVVGPAVDIEAHPGSRYMADLFAVVRMGSLPECPAGATTLVWKPTVMAEKPSLIAGKPRQDALFRRTRWKGRRLAVARQKFEGASSGIVPWIGSRQHQRVRQSGFAGFTGFGIEQLAAVRAAEMPQEYARETGVVTATGNIG